jgi:predicted nucleic acid-binding protein
MKKSASVVINTSPWITLSVCGQIGILKKLYENILMPKAVQKEIMAGGRSNIGIKEFEKAEWLKIKEIHDISKIFLLHELDRGEAEVIVLAQEQGINEVIIDERVARMQAQVTGLKVVGSLGLLLKSKKLGIIKEIKPLIEKIMKAGIYVHQNIINGILYEAKE